MTSILFLALVGFAAALWFALAKSRERSKSLVERIDAILPQTQCEKCGYPGCKPYATAIANGEADINQCPPGGAEGIRQLARLLGREPKPLDTTHGVEKPRTVAVIDEKICIGCTLCIQACPVDAIIGASKQMHTVMPELCTGCDLCIAPCPVDCIAMVPVAENIDSPKWHPVFWSRLPGTTPEANAARERHEVRLQRLERERQEHSARLAAKTVAGREKAATVDAAQDAKRALIAAAMERARAQKATVEPRNTIALTPEQQEQIDRIEARRAHLHEDQASPDAQADGDGSKVTFIPTDHRSDK